MSPGSHDLKLVKGFILQTESVPRSMRLSKARGDSEMGGMSYCTQPYSTKKKKKRKKTYSTLYSRKYDTLYNQFIVLLIVRLWATREPACTADEKVFFVSFFTNFLFTSTVSSFVDFVCL